MEHALTNIRFLRQSSKLIMTYTSEYYYYLPSIYKVAMRKLQSDGSYSHREAHRETEQSFIQVKSNVVASTISASETYENMLWSKRKVANAATPTLSTQNETEIQLLTCIYSKISTSDSHQIEINMIIVIAMDQSGFISIPFRREIVTTITFSSLW